MVSDSSKAFFFLIDGLDEFDSDCDELAEFLLETTSNKLNVKLCLASRPWLVFEDAFRLQPSLRMEDLTIHDIRLFVLGTLDQSPMYVGLRRHNRKDAKGLTEAVTKMASGVFLWVRLVVKSLLDGLRDGDTVVTSTPGFFSCLVTSRTSLQGSSAISIPSTLRRRRASFVPCGPSTATPCPACNGLDYSCFLSPSLMKILTLYCRTAAVP